MLRSRSTPDDAHEHLCLYCGRWSRATAEDDSCPRCHRENPAVHSAHQLLGVWGLNVFLEDQGVSEGMLDPSWVVRIVPGASREEVTLEVGWSSAEPAAAKRLLTRWFDSVGLDPKPRFRQRSEPSIGSIWAASEVFSLEQFTHPAGLYRLVAGRVALIVASLLSLNDTIAKGEGRPRPPAELSWVGEWLVRFLSAPPLLDPRRLVEQHCVRCFHEEAGYFEPGCTYFRDDPELAWAAGGEPWYDLMVSLGESVRDEELRPLFLSGPDGAMPQAPLDGSPDAFSLIGRTLSHFRPRRCPGYIPMGRMLTLLDDWSQGKANLIDVALGALDPLLIRSAGDQLGLWLADLFEGKIQPFERKTRRPGETAYAANRLLSLAEWISAGALDAPQRVRNST